MRAARPTPVTMLKRRWVVILNAMSRAALFRRSARKAREADREESCRAWLIVARDWLAMADREENTQEPPRNKEQARRSKADAVRPR
jgi:hypothetical protein